MSVNDIGFTFSNVGFAFSNRSLTVVQLFRFNKGTGLPICFRTRTYKNSPAPCIDLGCCGCWCGHFDRVDNYYCLLEEEEESA